LKGICAAFVLVAACSSTNNYPVLGGGGGGGNSGGGDAGGQIDAPTDGASDAVPGDGGTIVGRVCLLSDLRDLTTCASTGAAGLTVTLGSGSATTGSATTTDDGSFMLMKPAATAGLLWQVTGATIVTSSMAFGAQTRIPAVTSSDYAALQGGNGVVAAIGQGAVMARITQAGSPLAGATASASPASQQYQVYYAGSNATQWGKSATDTTGTAWLPGFASTQPAVVTVAASGGTPSATFSVTVPDSGIAFVMPDLAP
jgi:hypothetical protein